VFAFSACHAQTPTPAIAPGRTCVVGAPQRPSNDSISIATTAPIGAAHAPQPANFAERFVFAQLYETLIRVDCDGRAYSGLARSWTVDATKTRVTFVLRDGARFWSGDPVTARDVVAAWQATAGSLADSNQVARRLADGSTLVDDHTLTVSLPNTDSLVFAEPALAIYKKMIGVSWPEGSGPYQAGEPARDVAPGQLALTPVDHTSPRLVIRSGPDARDAIDSGIDLLLTADPVALSYASTRPDYITAPLPWSRTYALAVPGRSASAVADALSGDSTAFRASLARDAVRADARATELPVWWAKGCENSQPQVSTPPNVSRRSARIVYRSDDRVAQGLAERLVAVGRRATAVALSPSDYARSLRSGAELAYIIALPRTSLAPCFDLAALYSSAPWLGVGPIADPLVPLIDTRDKIIMKRDHVSALVDWDGTLRMSDRP
jgi:hypothetical protein